MCRHLLNEGFKVAYFKPVQTGAQELDGKLISVDTEYVKSICSDELRVIEPVIFKLPASPHLAAAEEGVEIDIDALLQKAKDVDDVDYLIVEGAGGIAVPFNNSMDMAGFCQKLGAELILVCRANLGTLNHTFLALSYAESFQLEASIIISGCAENPDVIEADNLKMIEAKSGGRIIGTIPLLSGLDTEDFSGKNTPEINFNV